MKDCFEHVHTDGGEVVKPSVARKILSKLLRNMAVETLPELTTAKK